MFEGLVRIPELTPEKYHPTIGKITHPATPSMWSTVIFPLGCRMKVGARNVHGGIECQVLGEMTKALNHGDGSQVIASIGVGWSR